MTMDAREAEEYKKRLNATLMPLTDSVVGAVIQRHRDRAAVGYGQYGTTMDRDDLSALEWVVHAQEEAMDLSVYLERLRRELAQLGEPHLPWAMVRAFHHKYDLRSDGDPQNGYATRLGLIDEEFRELGNALTDLASLKGERLATMREHVLKEWADLLFVVWGMAVEFGFDHVGVEAFRRVAESNMTKDGGIDGNGKLTKGPGYQEPDMEELW